MTSVSAFNDMMAQFLNELKTTFPEEKAIKKYNVAFDLMRQSNPKKCVEVFMETVGPYADRISRKDETLISEKIKLIEDLNLDKYWTPDLADATKGAIWNYLQTLHMLGATITAIPADTMSGIEQLAQKCAGQVSETGKLDEKALMSGVSGLLSQMGTDVDLGSLLSGVTGGKN